MPNRIGAPGPAVPTARPGRPPAATFAAYLREHDVPADHPNLEGWRALWRRELQVEQQRPRTVPPCPSWCLLPAAHDYSDVDGWDEDLTFEREHVAFRGDVADVQATEHNRAGEVTVDAPVIFLAVRIDAYTVEGTRVVAVELLEAVAVLERVSQAAT